MTTITTSQIFLNASAWVTSWKSFQQRKVSKHWSNLSREVEGFLLRNRHMILLFIKFMPWHKAFSLKWACKDWPYKEPLGMYTLLNVLEKNVKMIFDATG